MLTPADAAPRVTSLTMTAKDSFRAADSEVAKRLPDSAPVLMN